MTALPWMASWQLTMASRATWISRLQVWSSWSMVVEPGCRAHLEQHYVQALQLLVAKVLLDNGQVEGLWKAAQY